MAHNYASAMTGEKDDLGPAVADDQYRDMDSPRRPLIEHATNGWQSEKTSYQAQETGLRDLESKGSSTNLSRSVASSRNFRRMSSLTFILLGLAFWLWIWYLRPQVEEEWEIKEGFLERENGTYGIAKSGHFDGVRLQMLEANLVPGGVDDPHGKRRLVFVGDIHGCAHELKKLLKQINFDAQTDHLIAVGDTISKGPENVEVLDELMRLGASSVRGNHEDRILALAPSFLQSSMSTPAEETSSKGAAKDAALLRKLSKHHLEYLHSMPLMLQVPALPKAKKPSHKKKSPIAEDILVVHAGLVPAVTLEHQDPFYVMNMRSIQTKTHLPLIEAAAKKTKSKPWKQIWGWYNDRLFRKKSLKGFEVWDDLAWNEDYNSWLGILGLASKKKWPDPQVVVYGHHAKAGLQTARWSKGLDTGCVRGGKLTAMVLDAKGKQKFVSVRCKDYR